MDCIQVKRKASDQLRVSCKYPRYDLGERKEINLLRQTHYYLWDNQFERHLFCTVFFLKKTKQCWNEKELLDTLRELASGLIKVYPMFLSLRVSIEYCTKAELIGLIEKINPINIIYN
jgi:hypothetical protein